MDLTFFRSFIDRMMRRRAQLAFFSVLSFLCLVATAVLTFQVFFKLEEYGSSRSDNIAWNLAQTEVDQAKLASALKSLSQGAPDRLREARIRFDAFYNRINTLQGSQTYQDALSGTDAAMRLDTVHRQLQELIPVFDADDQTLTAQRDRLLEAVTALAPTVRALSIEGITIDATRSIAEREALTSKLIQLTLLSLLLVAMLLSLMQTIRRSRLNVTAC